MRLKKLLLLTVVTAGSGLTLISSASAQSFGGYATGVEVTIPATGTTIRAATGTLPPSGGTVEASLLTTTIPGSLTGGAVTLSAGTLHSAAVGLAATNAEASMESLNLTISSNQITADFLMARSKASCGPGPAVTGSSQVANLVINGQTITVTGAANQTVALPNGTAIINEQLPTVAGSIGKLNVNALHVTTTDTVTGQQLADVLLAAVDAEITCQPADPGGLSTTGGGWIPVFSAKGTFGIVGAIPSGGIAMGHIVFTDHFANVTVQSTSIISVTTNTITCTTTITANGNDNLGPVTITVDVTDAGEPGTSDTFSITTERTSASGTLAGGNIQVHRPACQ